MADLDDRLELKIVAARGLAEVAGGECSPYCVASIGGDKQTTGVQSTTVDPVWNASSLIFSGLGEAGVDHVVCVVKHKSGPGAEDVVLGQVVVDLQSAILSPGIASDEWYALLPAPGQAPTGQKLGELQLELAYFLQEGGVLPDDFDSDDSDAEAAKSQPNMLEVHIFRARSLMLPGKPVVDAYATLAVDAAKQKTQIVPKTNAPNFDAKFQIPVADGALRLLLKVKNRGILQNATIGQAVVPMVEVASHGAAGVTMWLRLDGDGGLVDGRGRGEVEVFMRWHYDAKYARSFSRLLKAAAALALSSGKMQRKMQPALSEAANPLLPKASADELWLLEQETFSRTRLSVAEQLAVDETREARVMMAEKRLADLETEHELLPGDYQIQVLGRTKKTRVIPKVNSCVFDETLFFNFTKLSCAAAEEATVSVAIFDYDAFSQHDLIGVCTFDLRAVHALPGHELYREWVGLVDTKSSKDNGYQGYLKLSITVLGPCDEQLSHDVEKEYQADLDKELDSGGGLGGMALVAQGPTAAKFCYLVVYVWQAQDLPKMYSGGLFSSAGIEAYVRCDFAGSTVKSSAISVKGRGSLAPVFHEELWIPVTEPTQARRIAVGLWDYNSFSKDKPVAHLYFDYDDVHRSADEQTKGGFFTSLFDSKKYKGTRPRWHNLYGAPLGVQGRRGKLANRYADEASTYRGRLLLSMEVITNPGRAAKQVGRVDPFHFKPTAGLEPSSAVYHLRVFAVLGTGLPVFKTAGLGAVKMGLTVSIGNHFVDLPFKPIARGVVEWNALEVLKGLELPLSLEELPDVCIYLTRGAPKVLRVCYARVPAALLLKEQFQGEPTWCVSLQPDKARTQRDGGASLAANSGAVLLQLGFGLAADALDVKFAWNDAALLSKVTEKKPYCLRVYVYQARNLPASDARGRASGLLDPYVKVRFCGDKARTAAASMTTSPVFYETLQRRPAFHEELPSDLRYGPDVVVWDHDNFSKNSPMCLLRLPLASCPLLNSETSNPPQPTWLHMTDTNGEALGAELLVAAALIPKRSKADKLNRAPDIKPIMRAAWLEVTSLGVRQLQGLPLRPAREPYVRMDVPSVGAEGGKETLVTKPSSKPSGRNANFLEKQLIYIELPENALFAPRMDLRVYDARVGLSTGLQAPLLGACFIDLGSKMSWNSEGYTPPQMELFDDAAVRNRAEEEEQRLKNEADEEAALEDDEDEADAAAAASKKEVTFGDVEDGNLDDNASSEGDEAAQDELERSGLVRSDGGTGAFDAMAISDLPMILEDMLFEEAQLQLALDLAAKEASEAKRGSSFLDMVEARLSAATREAPGEEVYKLSNLDIAFPSQWAAADYLEGRDWWVEEGGKELEAFLKTKPFETYPVYRGKYHTESSKSTLRIVGYFKGVIRVLDADPVFEAQPFLPLKLIRPPQEYTARDDVRLYVIRGANLQPVDGNSCDPYLRVKLGSEVDERPRDHRPKTLKPDFYETSEAATVLPGPSTLKIQVRDWNRFYPVHELVGETHIDLEDRWFHRDWQKLDAVDARLASSNPLKPIEVRALRKESSSVVQGSLQLWVEVRRCDDARRDKAVELKGPDRRKFEVRIICWKSKDVPFEMGDYYCQFQLGAARKQKTDVHWRCRKGKASWNWRICIPVELPLSSPEQGRLAIQLWDQDVFKWNDVLGDSQIDLYRWFLKAYQEQKSIEVFKTINDAVRRKRNADQGLANDADLEESDADSGSDSEDEDDEEAPAADAPASADVTLAGDLEAGAARDGGAPPGDSDAAKKDKDAASAPAAAPKKKKKKQQQPSVSAEGDADAAADKDAMYFVSQLKDMVGLGDLDATAQRAAVWVRLTYSDRKRNRVLDRGAVAISVEILPADEALLKPAGHGRSEPNTNPVLPPTADRLSFSYNPFAIFSAMLGPKLAFQIACCVCCVLLIVVIGVLGSYFTSVFSVLESLGLAQRR
ncbi:hypothetical protein M885DRAFT_451451 [Pelagophyceae sp. CCMP2097]|nr:hypothetical protein M885DRAFT_451451 [Pelagophyceae sp. CCMP2097]